MPQSLSKVILHIVFSTKHRVPCLTPAIRSELFPYMATVLNNLGCPAIEVGGEKDHLHALCLLGRQVTIAQLIEGMKKPTSKWMKTKSRDYATFHWQNGYAAFSVSESGIAQARAYIQNQEEHHKTMSFQDELRVLLKRYKVEHDENYLWD